MGNCTAPKLFHDFATAGQHDFAVPPCQLVAATVLLQVSRDLATADGGTEGGELIAFVFQDADFNLALAK